VIFFPILYNIPGFNGQTTLHNFPPNNWEKFFVKSKSINISWTDGERWNSKKIGTLKPYDSKTISYEDIKSLLPSSSSFPLLSLTKTTPSNLTRMFDYKNHLGTSWPMWRATIGLEKDNSITSYQGELVPFPSTGTMLSFAPFVQLNSEVSYLVIVNIETHPEFRDGLIEIFSSKSKEKKMSKTITTNNISVIDITGINLDEDDMLIFKSINFSAIPLIFSASDNYKSLSIEHTHPPAALSILGERFLVQKDIKKKWFQLLK
jgi:hypothetical protein